MYRIYIFFVGMIVEFGMWGMWCVGGRGYTVSGIQYSGGLQSLKVTVRINHFKNIKLVKLKDCRRFTATMAGFHFSIIQGLSRHLRYFIKLTEQLFLGQPLLFGCGAVGGGPWVMFAAIATSIHCEYSRTS